MRFSTIPCALLLSLACSPAATEQAPVAPAPEPPPAAPVIAEPAPAPEPKLTPEEEKAAAEKKKLEEDYAKLEAEDKAERERLTPEVRAAVKAITDKGYYNVRTALDAALKGPQRRSGHADRDQQRHPRETLEFFGLKPNQTVLEIGPGEGWYTELLAPALAKNGKLLVTATDPAGPRDQRATYYGLRTKMFLDALPEAYGKVELVVVDSKAPKLPQNGTIDTVLLFRGAHGMYNNKLLDAWLAEIHHALKPKGILAIEQHRAAPGANPDESSKKGYLPEAFLIEKIEQAGFKLLAKSEINANPKDTKDHPHGVWSLPPSLRDGDKDKEKYLAIGESDRMTLKFQRRELPKTAAAPAAAAPAKAPAAAAPAKAPAAPAAAPAAPAAAPAAPAKPAPAAPAAAPTMTSPLPTPAPTPAPAPVTPPAKK